MFGKKVVFNVGDEITTKKEIRINSGDNLIIPKKKYGKIKEIIGGSAVVIFNINGLDREVMVRFDYMKKA